MPLQPIQRAIPFSSDNQRAITNASSSWTCCTSRPRTRSSNAGTKPAPIPRIPCCPENSSNKPLLIDSSPDCLFESVEGLVKSNRAGVAPIWLRCGTTRPVLFRIQSKVHAVTPRLYVRRQASRPGIPGRYRHNDCSCDGLAVVVGFRPERHDLNMMVPGDCL